MHTNFSSFSRRGPDNVTEELVSALSNSKTHEFKTLFLQIYAALQARNAASGGEEMMRLRAYEKLQDLVMRGQVVKTGKKYKGVIKSLQLLTENLKEFRKSRAVPPAKTPVAVS